MGYIYKFQNLINGKVYIGQTIRTPKQRFKEHLNASNQGKDKTIFHQALRKYGIDNFSFNIIEECDDSLLNSRESHWINYYNSKENGYNMTYGGDSGNALYNPKLIQELWKQGATSLEIQKKLGCCSNIVTNALNRYNIPLEERYIRASEYKTKAVDQYTLDGIYLNTFPSVAIAAKATSNETSAISNACNKKITSSGGYIWKYNEDTTSIEELVKKASSKMHHGHTKVAQYNLDGTYIQTFNSVKEAAIYVGAKSQTSITNVCKGRAKTSFGYIWKYVLNS